MTKKMPQRLSPSINEHFRKEWLFHAALLVVLIVLSLLAAVFGPLLLDR